MAELKVVDAKKDLQGIVSKAKVSIQKEKESLMPEQERQALADKQKKEQESKVAEKAKAEEQKKKDAEILAKKEEELSEAEVERKKIIFDEQKKKDEQKLKVEDAKLSTDEKIERIKEKSQKRIDEITNEIKQLKDQTSKEAQTLRGELEILRLENEELSKKPEKEKDVHTIVAEQEKKIIEKYLEEDKDKSREQRREMPKEELDDWLADDIGAALSWQTRRDIRRDRERENVGNYILFNQEQQKSLKKLEYKYPELNVKVKQKELMDSGKTLEEAIEIISKENKMFKLSYEIAVEHPEWGNRVNAPELVMVEMEKRLKEPDEKTEGTKTSEQEEISALRKQNEDLETRLQALENSDVGITSTHRRTSTPSDKLTEAEETLVSTMKKLKAPEVNIQSALKKHREKQKR